MTSSWGVRAKGQILVGWDWSLPLWLTGCPASAASTWAQYSRRTQYPWAWVCPCQSAWTRWTSWKYSQSERKNWLKIPLIIRSLGRIHQKIHCKLFFLSLKVRLSGEPIRNWKIALLLLGVLAPGSAHACPSPQPTIATSRIFSLHVCFCGWGGQKNWKIVLLIFLIFQAILSTLRFFLF